jgi:photosystem II stability/assembly factor-like uncharacterized protein
VTLHRRLGLPALFCLAAGLLLTPPAPPPARAEEKTREQQIADLEKQIQELQQKLEELKKAPAPPAPPKADGLLPADWTKALNWRCIGPAAMGGRIVAIAAYEPDPTTYWIATASGGLLKTVNNGVTFEHQFDREATVSIGDVCVAPSNKDVIWVGTGEANPRNSVSYGDGVYKSTDGGKTWQNMGLKKCFQVGRIAVHPTNPDVVYVGALGRLYGPNEERGVYKTTDGGKTWRRVFNVNDQTGVIDVQMSPADPETLIVAMWERKRDEFDSHRGEPPLEDGYDAYDPIKKWGPGGGLYKTTDGGEHWHKLTQGLPSSPMGRVGLSWYRKNPNEVFAIIDCQKIGMGTPPVQVYLGIQGEDAPGGGAKLNAVSPNTPAAKAGLQSGDVITAVGSKPLKNYAELGEQITARKAGEPMELTVRRDKTDLGVTAVLDTRSAAPEGVNKNRPWSFAYGGQRENAQDLQGPDSFEYGGVYKSVDAGESWTRVNSLNPRPMYFSQIRVDPSDDKYLYVCGISLYRSADGGKTFKPDGNNGVHPDQHALWIDPHDGRHMVVGCDGGFYVTYDRMDHWDFLNQMAIGQFYHVAVDNKQPYHVYGGLQDNGSWGGPSRSLSNGLINEDWIAVGGGDGFVCRVDSSDSDIVYWESQDGNVGRRNLRTGERGALRPQAPGERASDRPQPPRGESPSDRPQGPRGESPYRFNWNTPFILSSHNPSIFYSGGNFVFRSVEKGSNAKPISPEISRTKRGTATALAESPKNADVLWAGTDDGNLWVTRDGGVKWTNVFEKVGLPGPRWVASIEASRFAEGRAYVAFDAHRSDDDEPYLFVTEDFGQTWKPLRGNLPTGSSRVLREDVENENLLYCGTEFAVWASLDRGGSWTRINNNLPTVAVHELALHPTAGEMVAATHGRSLWVLDVTPLRQMTEKAVKAKAFLYKPNAVTRWRQEPARGSMYGTGSRRYVAENPPFGAQVYYSLTAPATKAKLQIQDYTGKTVIELKAKTEPGLHRIDWNLTTSESASPLGPFGPRRAAPAPAGMYRVVLKVDDDEYQTGLKVEADPTLPNAVAADGDEDAKAATDDDDDDDRPPVKKIDR